MATSSKSKSYSRRSIGAVLLVGVLAGVTVGGGVGVFAASSTKTVTVCVDKKDNHMNYSKDSKCKSHQYKVVLNQKGVAGAKGDTGAAGAKGDTGAAGAKGDTGAAGAKGDTGAAGAKGDTGAAGTNGTNGTNGAAGGSAITQQSVCDGTDADATANELCKIGMTGPGGGHVFLVDYYDQYAGFDYLEAAPVACEQANTTWSVADTAVTAARGWAARGVGAGQANTTAILAVFTSATTSNNAAKYADSLTCGTQTDWFLGSIGEMKLMYNNLQSVGSFASDDYYWSSTEDSDPTKALHQSFHKQLSWSETKSFATSYVRPVRDF